ncbi:DUF413 domain-containing protein [Gemmata sp. JC673]|uniref:Macrodomain Ori protein n=1 Tax=Gemmata algarum TaxID=2975278 RepID=A0ABU5F0L4_9BACT|nr:DUF413 domain-containing protein [Gemmata algarum]MDY3561100.1 DUF413 domain-containing protein [Gemmata algarum]
MLHPEDHAAYLARHDFFVPPGESFTPAERELLTKYGRWMEALVSGAIRPTTPSQEQFVRVARGEGDPASDFERAWVKVMRERDVAALVSDRLHALQAARAKSLLLDAEYRDARTAVLATIRDQLDEVDAAFAEQIQAASAEAAQAEQELRELVLSLGRSVGAGAIKVTYRSPPVTWDSDKLAAYAEEHPEILAFRKTGKPSVALRYSDGLPARGTAASELSPPEPAVPSAE